MGWRQLPFLESGRRLSQNLSVSKPIGYETLSGRRSPISPR